MYFFKIWIILGTSIFIQICKTEENLPVKRSRTKSNQELENCVCFPEGESLYPELLNPQNNGLQRLVVYLYRDINTNEIKVFTPDSEKQATIPNIPVAAADELKTITSETVASLMANAPNNILNMDLGNTKRNYIEFIPGLQQGSQEMYQKPDHYKQNNPYNEAQNRPITFSDLYQSNNLNPYRLKKLFIKKPKESLSVDLSGQPNFPLYPYEEKNEPNKTLTFDQWFNHQMEVFRDNKATPAIHTLDTDIIKPLVQKVLNENNMNIDSSGLITDSNGVLVNLHKLELRSVLIGSPVTYQQFLQGDLPLADNLPYLEGILITMLKPPRILGVIPLYNAHYATQSDSTMNSNTPDVNIDHYFLAPKSYIDKEHNNHPSTLSSDLNIFYTSSALTPLKVEQNSKVPHNNDPLLNLAPSSEINVVSTQKYDNWLHTLLKTVVDKSKEKILDVSKRFKNAQKQIIPESKKDLKHQIIQDSAAPYNPFYFQPNSESSHVYTIPFSLTSDGLPTNVDNLRIPYTYLKGPLYSDPHNMQPHMMTIPNNIIDKPQRIYPKIVSSFYKDPNQTPRYDIDGTPLINDVDLPLVTPPINKILHISDSTVETDSPLNAIEETGSKIITSSADVSNLESPVINTGIPYLTLPNLIDSSNSNLNLIHDSPLIYQHAGEKSIHPGQHVYTKPKNSRWQAHGNNREQHNVISKNVMDISNPRSLYGKHVFKSNSFENKNKILGYSNNMKQNRRQNLSAYAKPIIKSIFDTFLEPFQYGKNIISQKNGDQATIPVDDTTKKPDAKDRPDYRIIGGSAATGSGSPLRNKGRSAFE